MKKKLRLVMPVESIEYTYKHATYSFRNPDIKVRIKDTSNILNVGDFVVVEMVKGNWFSKTTISKATTEDKEWSVVIEGEVSSSTKYKGYTKVYFYGQDLVCITLAPVFIQPNRWYRAEGVISKGVMNLIITECIFKRIVLK